MKELFKFKVLAVVSAFVLVLSGCSSSVTSIGIPSDSPWRKFGTMIASQYNDLTATPVGMVTNASITGGLDPVLACKSDQGRFFVASDIVSGDPSTWDRVALCNAQASHDASVIVFTNVAPLGIYYLWGLSVETDPTVATTGGVTVESASVGNLFGISFNQTASGLNIGAGASPSILPAPNPITDSVLSAQYGQITMTDSEGGGWSAYQAGGLCADGTTGSCPGSSLLALCIPAGTLLDGILSFLPDMLIFNTNTTETKYSLNCGIPVNFTMTGAYPTVGSCIDTSIKNNCAGLKGNARSACVTANIGVCQASFNKPSALAN